MNFYRRPAHLIPMTLFSLLLLMAVWLWSSENTEFHAERSTRLNSIVATGIIPAHQNSGSHTLLGGQLLHTTSLLAIKPKQSRLQALADLNSSQRNMKALNQLNHAYEKMAYSVTTIAQETAIRIQQIADYHRLLQIDPEWPELLYRVSLQKIALQRLQPERLELLNQAIKNLNLMIDITAYNNDVVQSSTGYFQLGRAVKHQGDRAFEVGDTSLGKERYQAALTALKKTLTLNPERIDAVGEIVLIYRTLDDVQAAVTTVRNSLPHLKKQHLAAKGYEMLGALLQETRQHPKAVAAFKQSLMLNERMMGAYLHLAQLSRQLSNQDQALQILQRSLKVEPNFIDGYLKLGALLVAKGHNAEATTLFERALAIDQADIVTLGMLPSRQLYINQLYYQAAAYLAWLYLENDQPKKALAMAHQAQQYQPLEAHLMDTIGIIHTRLGNKADAMQAFIRAIKATALPSAHYHLAEILLQQGSTEQAQMHIGKALASSRPFYYRKYAEALKKKIDLSAARDDSSDK